MKPNYIGKLVATITLVACFSTFSILLSSYSNWNYRLTEDYSISFSTTRAEGTFSELKGYVNFSEDLSACEMNVSIAANTIKTGNKTKDKHARNSKWLNAKKYPKITFISKSLGNTANGYQVTGDLTIKETTLETIIIFTSQDIDGINYLIGNTTISREAFHIMGNSFAFLVGDDININIKVPSNYDN